MGFFTQFFPLFIDLHYLVFLSILDYERDSRKLSQKLFGDAKTVLRSDLTEEENQMLAYYLGATTYGNLFNWTLHRMQEFQPDGEPLTTKTKGKYVISRMFPNMEWCKCYAPVVYKFPVLLEVLLVAIGHNLYKYQKKR